MIHRHHQAGQRLDVAGLNEITVLIDRSETERTEVGMNGWQPGLDGPPHAHARKEQNFLVTSGRGLVKVGDQTFPAAPGALFYLPAGVVHQTLTQGEAPLVYFLFNAFLDADKEGHATFAEHIEHVKAIRRRQADEQHAGADPEIGVGAPPPRPGRCIPTSGITAARTVLLSRAETERCETVHHRLDAGEDRDLGAEATKEQTCFVLSGGGRCTVGSETVDLATGEVVFVPRGSAARFTAGADGLALISFGTVVHR